MRSLAERIKALRIERGLSQKELASLVGVTSGAVSNWEAGTRENIRGEPLFALAAALGVSPEDLLARAQTAEVAPVEELQLLAAFRQLSPERKRIALHLIKALKSAA
jgi:transcriptional regulator with XRE-family HTH domain